MFFSLEHALASVGGVEGAVLRALGRLLPGPVTALIGNPDGRFLAACGPDPTTLGLRVPRLAASLAGLAAVRAPVMQSSANLSGRADARRLADVPPEMIAGADLVLDGGELPGRPSTVIDLRRYGGGGEWTVVREGALATVELQLLLAS